MASPLRIRCEVAARGGFYTPLPRDVNRLADLDRVKILICGLAATSVASERCGVRRCRTIVSLPAR